MRAHLLITCSARRVRRCCLLRKLPGYRSSPELYSKAPKDYPNPFKTKMGGVSFDDKLSSARRDVVNSLYDHIITFRHNELKDAWTAIYRAEAALAKSKSANAAQGKTLVAEARKVASQMPINDQR